LTIRATYVLLLFFMSAPATMPSANDETDSLDGWERALLDRQLEALGRLADMGMAIAAAVERRATAEAPGADAVVDRVAPNHTALNHAVLDFARVSRAVRMSFALQSRLIADFKGGSRTAAGEPDGRGPIEVRWREDVVENDEVQKRQVCGIVERLGEAASLDGETVERLVSEAGERLEDEGLYHDLTRRPLGEIVALICKDLGLEPDWDRVAREFWAEEEIRRPPPGSPYAGWTARQAGPPVTASAGPPASRGPPPGPCRDPP
jgi:hypothetical protein